MKVLGKLIAAAVLAAAVVPVGFAIAQQQPGAFGAPAAPPPPAASAQVPPSPPVGTPASTALKAASGAPATAAAHAASVTPAATAPATASAAPSPNQTTVKSSQAQLQQMLAPVALYPDQLLGQVLMASTYPLELVEAARWVKVPANRKLSGNALMTALKQKNWDPSVMALVPFPRLLDVMSERLQWTEQLGNAFLAQQADVMAAVQQLRREAMQAGNLEPAMCRCKVTENAGEIAIAPANPAEVYVPVCNPRVVYGAWPYPLYPPMVFPVPIGFAWEPVPFIGFYPLVTVAWFDPLWGWAGFDWWHANIIVSAAAYGALSFGHPGFAGAVWVHDPAHRGGIAYADPAVAARFGGRAAVAAAGLRAAADPRAAAAAARAGGVGSTNFRGAAAAHAGGSSAFRGAARAAVVHGGVRAGAFHGGPRVAFRGGAFHGGGFHGGFRGAGFHGGGVHAGGFHGGGFHGGGGHGHR